MEWFSFTIMRKNYEWEVLCVPTYTKHLWDVHEKHKYYGVKGFSNNIY